MKGLQKRWKLLGFSAITKFFQILHRSEQEIKYTGILVLGTNYKTNWMLLILKADNMATTEFSGHILALSINYITFFH
jgi:hypothetical protein